VHQFQTKEPTVAIIGSFRQYYQLAVTAALQFESASISVSTPPVSQIVDPEADFVRFETDAPDSEDHEIQSETLERIFESDVVYVIAPSGYIGRTTSYELGRVHERGIPVFYSEAPRDLPIPIADESVKSVEELTDWLRANRMQEPLARTGHV
jgi:hypothetical protein